MIQAYHKDMCSALSSFKYTLEMGFGRGTLLILFADDMSFSLKQEAIGNLKIHLDSA